MKRIRPQMGQGARRARRGWGIAVALMLALSLGTVACGGDKKGGTTQVQLFPPTLNGAPPTQTAEAKLSLQGGKTQGVGVMAILNGTPVEVAPINAINQWEGDLTLQEGENTFALVAFDAAGNMSAQGNSYTVTLDTMAPAAPSLAQEPEACIPGDEATLEGTVEADATLYINGEAAEDAVSDDGSFSVKVELGGEATEVVLYAEDAVGNRSGELTYSLRSGLPTPTVEMVTSPTGDRTQTLSGTKEAGVGVLLRLEGQEDGTQIVPSNQDTTWSYDLELGEGTTTFYIDAIGDGDRRGCEEAGPFEIIYSSVCAPSVDRTGLPLGMIISEPSSLDLTITRCEGVETWIRQDSQPLDGGMRVDGDGDGETFTVTYDLQEGLNTLWVYNKDGEGLISPQDGPLEVTLDTLAPNAPVITDPAQASIESVEVMYTIAGTKDAGSGICMIRNPNTNCEVTLPVNNQETFMVPDVQLELGNNTFEFVAMDGAGNMSRAARVTIVRANDDTPTIQILNPADGALIVPGQLEIQARINAAREITSNELCFDDNCAPGTVQGDFYRRTVTVPESLENGSPHTVTVTASNDLDQEGSATSTVLFINGGLPLSTTTPEAVSRTPRLAMDGMGHLHAFWSDDCSNEEGCEATEGLEGGPFVGGDLFHRVLSETGWSPINIVSSAENDGDSRAPDVAVSSDGNVHLVWQDDGNIDGFGGDTDIFYRYYDISNGTWSAIETVSAGSSIISQEPAVTVTSDGTVHVAWEESDGITTVVYSRRATNGSWTMAVPLSNPELDSRLPELDVDLMDRIYAVWQEDQGNRDHDIMLAVAENNNFGDAIVVSDNVLDGDSYQPQLAVDTQNVAHIVWRDDSELFNSGTDDEVFYRSYNHNSGTLSTYSLITTMPPDALTGEISINIDPATDDIYVAWGSLDDPLAPGTDVDIYYTRGLQGIFGAPVLVSEGDEFSGFGSEPDALYDPMSNTLHVIWADDSAVLNTGADQDIFYYGFRIE